MNLPEPVHWSTEDAGLDEWLAQAPQRPGVFLITAREGEPYLGRTSQLKRRLNRLLGERAQASRLLHLRDLAASAEYWQTPSWLENALVSYTLARRHFPENYAKVLRLPRPPYVKLITSNRFPRTQVTTLLGGRSRYWGPFATRAAAEEFEKGALDLFQVRRCQEELVPAPDHPGCIYGEMHMCLRPCQAAVTDAEYATEVARLEEFLLSGGEAAAEAVRRSRDRLSDEMQFEEAARQHARLERIIAAQKLAGELSADPRELCGVAITKGLAHDTVRLWFVLDGLWSEPKEIFLAPGADGKPVSLDTRIKEVAAGAAAGERPPDRDRQEHLAILARWFYSGSRDGEWLPFPAIEKIPWRKLVNAVHRVCQVSH
jgi:excinuclease UvrABC nuclease subunit